MTVTPGPGAGRSRRFEMAGAVRRVRASEKYALGKEPSRQLPVRRPAGCYGVRIGRCPCSSGATGPCRGLVLCEPVRIRAVTGVGPRRSANAGCRRSLVRRPWWRDGYPCTGLAAGQPRRQRRDGRVRHGYSPRHPRTRPDMAGRQRQPVPVTRPADPMPCARTPRGSRSREMRRRYDMTAWIPRLPIMEAAKTARRVRNENNHGSTEY